MGKKKDEIFSSDAEDQTISEVFAKQPKTDPGAQDVFSGNDNFYRGLNRGIVGGKRPWWKWSPKDTSKGGFPLMQTFVVVNLVAITGIVGYLLFRPPAINIAAPDPGISQKSPDDIKPDVHEEKPDDKSTGIDPEILDKAVSWKSAEMLFDAQDYKNASYVYDKLSDNLPANIPGNDILKDYLQFKIALCMHKTDDQTDVSGFFTVALQSHSPVVRGLANYRLAFIESDNEQYLSARKRAYQTIALLKAFEDTLPPNMEGDCYFIAAEALTRHILALNNEPEALPGQLWTDSMAILSVPLMDQAELRNLLSTGMGKLTGAAMRPRIEKQEHVSIGMRWSAVSMNASLEELLERFASAAKMNLLWHGADESVRTRSTSLYLPSCSEQIIAEVAAGSTGLIARLDGENIAIRNPESYENMDEYKKMLINEAIAVWRRFLIRYRGDHRAPNAHFALGLLNDYAGQTPTALGEYKLVAGRYPNNPLTPFALLNSSIIKTNLRDYPGARRDLTEIIIQYPDCKVVDRASLYHADATMKSGLYDDAIKSFHRVYNLDLNEKSKRDAAYGLGKCFFEIENYPEARRWFITAIELTENITDQRLRNSYFMLGKSCIELGQFAEASSALANAVDDSASREDFVGIILQMVKAQVGQENYVDALNILENVPVEKLSQKNACAVLKARAEIFRKIDLVDTAITLLRRRIQFIADSVLRAELTFELAKCCLERGDYRIARKEVTDALMDLPSGTLSQEAYLLLADVSIRLGNYIEAKDTCQKLLAQDIEDEQIRRQGLAFLGRSYAKMKQHDQAAMVYAGSRYNTGIELK